MQRINPRPAIRRSRKTYNTTYKNLLPQIAGKPSRISYPDYEIVNRPLQFVNEIDNIAGYKLLPSIGDRFVSFCKPDFYNQLTLDPYISPINTGWKAHLSCHPSDLNKLWGITVPILIANNCPAFKCIKLINNQNAQGRTVDNLQFTIFIPQGEEEKYNNILAEIEAGLEQSGVRLAADIPLSDRRLGLYSSVRFSGYGYPPRYIAEREAEVILNNTMQKHKQMDASWYNVEGHNDPFKLIRNSAYQLLQAEQNEMETEEVDSGAKKRQKLDETYSNGHMQSAKLFQAGSEPGETPNSTNVSFPIIKPN